MKKQACIASLLLSLCTAHAGSGIHWAYSGALGPDHWGSLGTEFSTCSTGRNQSTIDLAGFIEADLKPISIEYQRGGVEVVNNGHTVKVNYSQGSQIAVDDHVYELKQFHFHSPSENHIEGRSFAMEAHFVHADEEGNLAVIAVMFIEGGASKAIADLWSNMPKKTGDVSRQPSSFAAEDLLPVKRDYYRFNGSLTTPPCSEGVLWLVMKEPVEVSKAQIEKVVQVMPRPNNRPVQAVNSRPVLR